MGQFKVSIEVCRKSSDKVDLTIKLEQVSLKDFKIKNVNLLRIKSNINYVIFHIYNGSGADLAYGSENYNLVVEDFYDTSLKVGDIVFGFFLNDDEKPPYEIDKKPRQTGTGGIVTVSSC